MATSNIRDLKIPKFVYKTFSGTYSINASDSTNITKSQIGYAVPAGYTFAGIMGFTTGASAVNLVAIRPDSDNIMTVRNVTNSAQSNKTMFLNILFVSTEVTKLT